VRDGVGRVCQSRLVSLTAIYRWAKARGVVVRVVPPEYLIALYLPPQAKTPRRRERAAMLLELPNLNRELLDEILGRHGLSL
jgi:hypothetical protein